MEVSVVIVNWNVCDLLRRCLASIDANRGDLSLEVIVVDNASSDDSVQMVKEEFPHVRLIASQKNLGYTGGNNLGAREARGRYLLILNPDTEIVGDALQQMVAYLDAHPTAGVVGPQLRYPDGSIQPSCHRFPTIAIALSSDSHIIGSFSQNGLSHAAHGINDQENEIQSVDWLDGAALMIRREIWQKVGAFDERFFMYFDEVDWFRRCQNVGAKAHYLAPAQIIHHHRGSSKQIGIKRKILFNRSKFLYFRKHFGAGWEVIIRLFSVLTSAWILILEMAKWVIDHREDRRERIRVNWKMIISAICIKCAGRGVQ